MNYISPHELIKDLLLKTEFDLKCPVESINEE